MALLTRLPPLTDYYRPDPSFAQMLAYPTPTSLCILEPIPRRSELFMASLSLDPSTQSLSRPVPSYPTAHADERPRPRFASLYHPYPLVLSNAAADVGVPSSDLSMHLYARSAHPVSPSAVFQALSSSPPVALHRPTSHTSPPPFQQPIPVSCLNPPPSDIPHPLSPPDAGSQAPQSKQPRISQEPLPTAEHRSPIKRTLIACERCRLHKLRCSGGNPCPACEKRGLGQACVYATKVRRRGKGKKKGKQPKQNEKEDGNEPEGTEIGSSSTAHQTSSFEPSPPFHAHPPSSQPHPEAFAQPTYTPVPPIPFAKPSSSGSASSITTYPFFSLSGSQSLDRPPTLPYVFSSGMDSKPMPALAVLPDGFPARLNTEGFMDGWNSLRGSWTSPALGNDRNGSFVRGDGRDRLEMHGVGKDDGLSQGRFAKDGWKSLEDSLGWRESECGSESLDGSRTGSGSGDGSVGAEPL